jgi:3-dehydroquinate dehydratase II
MLDTVRAAAASAAGIIISTCGVIPAACELHCALASAHIPIVEIRTNSIGSTQSSACSVVISGAGILGYKLAIDYVAAAGEPRDVILGLSRTQTAGW